MKTKLIISGLVFLVITTLASGQNKGIYSPPQNGTRKGEAYVDANNNGICDNFENRTSNSSFCKRSGNVNCCGLGQRHERGQKRNCQRQGRGRNFIDADKNGICDHNEIPANK